MKPEDFIKDYESAIATQDWKNVKSLIHNNASITFSTGSVHRGKSEVKIAFENNFSSIKNEKYSIANVSWLLKSESVAVFLFDFNWKGIINDNPAKGAGRGTSVLVNEDGKWCLLTEHLGPMPKNLN